MEKKEVLEKDKNFKSELVYDGINKIDKVKKNLLGREITGEVLKNVRNKPIEIKG